MSIEADIAQQIRVDPGQLPIVLCPGGQLLRNPSEIELRAAWDTLVGNVKRTAPDITLDGILVAPALACVLL